MHFERNGTHRRSYNKNDNNHDNTLLPIYAKVTDEHNNHHSNLILEWNTQKILTAAQIPLICPAFRFHPCEFLILATICINVQIPTKMTPALRRFGRAIIALSII